MRIFKKISVGELAYRRGVKMGGLSGNDRRNFGRDGGRDEGRSMPHHANATRADFDRSRMMRSLRRLRRHLIVSSSLAAFGASLPIAAHAQSAAKPATAIKPSFFPMARFPLMREKSLTRYLVMQDINSAGNSRAWRLSAPRLGLYAEITCPRLVKGAYAPI